MSWTPALLQTHPRKKLVIRLPEYKPEPEKPARICKSCEMDRPGWRFDDGYHPDICGTCVWFPMPRIRDEHHADLSNDDRKIVLSAEAIIRRLKRGEKNKPIYRAHGRAIRPDAVHGLLDRGLGEPAGR